MSSPNRIPQELIKDGRKRFVPSIRERSFPPTETVRIPIPKDKLPQPPQKINLLLSILPPALMIGAMAIITLLLKNGSLMVMLPMFATGLAFPLANIIGVTVQKKNYQKEMNLRAANYNTLLKQTEIRMHKMESEQCSALVKEYPSVNETIQVALNKGKDARMWWRRPTDDDFLSLRMGVGEQDLSFKVEPPNNINQDDPLLQSAYDLLERHLGVKNVPILLDLKNAGSSVIVGQSSELAYEFVYRLLLDILVFHSPQDVSLAIVSDKKEAADKWGWVKWAPHVGALYPTGEEFTLAFTRTRAEKFLMWLNDEVKDRKNNARSAETTPTIPLVVLFDDTGLLRQRREIINLAMQGSEIGIYLIFLGSLSTPSSCRTRIDLDSAGHFRYLETWNSAEKGFTEIGMAEFAQMAECLQIARTLSQFEFSIDPFSISLPPRIHLSQLVNPYTSSIAIIDRWRSPLRENEQLLFPIGFQVDQGALKPLILDLLSSTMGGSEAYHTLLIGTTGSGKGVFMKTMLLAAAAGYSPTLLNFFCMDFKGGATFDAFKDLPHVVGVVDNLPENTQLTRRGITALKSEILRREGDYKTAQVQDIWQYNRKNSKQPKAQLLVFLDEFAAGLNEFPELEEVLNLIVRKGRSLGIYLFLANQDKVTAVDKLLPNMGWRICLKVADLTEIQQIISREIKDNPEYTGRGFLRHSATAFVSKFQSPLGFLPKVTNIVDTQSIGEFEIMEVAADGSLSQLYKYQPVHSLQVIEPENQPPSEEATLIGQIIVAAQKLNSPRHLIYLPPLAKTIPLSQLLETQPTLRKFQKGDWTPISNTENHLAVPIGYLDFPNEVKQTPLIISFDQQGSNLAVHGSAGSGVEMLYKDIVLSLAYSHTPQEVQFYLIGDVADFASIRSLPHIGSSIRNNESERLERLFRFINSELNNRAQAEDLSSVSDIFLMINNISEFRGSKFMTDDMDGGKADSLKFIAQRGEKSKIHLIVSAPDEKLYMLKDILPNAVALEMANNDLYQYVLKMKPIELTVNGHCPGRGYWTLGNGIAECQMATPDTENLVPDFAKAWRGNLPVDFQVLEKNISVQDALVKYQPRISEHLIPIGKDYETLDPVVIDINNAKRMWLILGQNIHGSTNFLYSMAQMITSLGPVGWEVSLFILRTSVFIKDWEKSASMSVFANSQEIEAQLNKYIGQLTVGQTGISSGKQTLILIDGLGAIYDPGKDKDPIGPLLEKVLSLARERKDFFVIAAADYRDVSSKMAYPLMKMLNQGLGIAFTNDQNAVSAFNPTDLRQVRGYLKQDIPAGRGILVQEGKVILLQTFLASDHRIATSSE